MMRHGANDPGNTHGTGDDPPIPRLSRRWRLARLALLLGALGLGFLGYLRPDLQVQWANLAAMCGF